MLCNADDAMIQILVTVTSRMLQNRQTLLPDFRLLRRWWHWLGRAMRWWLEQFFQLLTPLLLLLELSQLLLPVLL